MRLTDDELLTERVAAATPCSKAAKAALGRLLTAHPHGLTAGSPLHSLVTGGPVDPIWRDQVKTCEGSLWSDLQFLIALYGEPEDCSDALRALHLLRSRAGDIPGPR
jgi:hypothetical protein